MAKQYGIVKIDTITYTSGGNGAEVDQSIDVSGLANLLGGDTTITGDIIVSGGAEVSGLLTVSGITVTGDAI